MKVDIDPVLRSTVRLGQYAKMLHEKQDISLLFYLKRESGILLRRAFKLWLRLKLGRIPWREENIK